MNVRSIFRFEVSYHFGARPESMGEIMLVNHSKPIRSSLAADPDFSDLVREFVGEIPSKLAMIQQSLAVGDMVLLRRTFHQLRGACGGYGFPMLSETAGLIEDRIKKVESISNQDPQINEFFEMLGRVTADPEPIAT